MKPLLTALILSTAQAALPQPVAAREIPTHGPFRTLAWCKDFTLGTRPSDRKDREGDGYDLWMQMPDSGPGGAGKEFRIDPIPFPGAKGGTLSIGYLPDGVVSPDARRVAVSQKICRGYAVAYVLVRNEEEEYEKQGFKPLPKLVSELGWDKFFSKEDAAAEEQHYVFLADLRQRFADSDRLIPRGRLEQETRARFDRYRKADRQGTAKGVMHGEARDVVDGQRELLLRASLKEGAVATLGEPN